MAQIILGKTGLKIEKNGFGALPIQRASFDETKEIVQKAYANGINFYDTARAYTDSEEKLNYAYRKFLSYCMQLDNVNRIIYIYYRR